TPDTPDTTPPPTPPGGGGDSDSDDGDVTVDIGGDDISQQQQQQMLGGLSPGVYSMFMQQISMVQMNQQMMMRQMMRFMMQNNYQQVNNQMLIQFMRQVMEVDIDEGDVNEGDVIVQIQQIIQQVQITKIEQNIEQIIQEVNITDITYIEQLMEILIAIQEGDIESQGDVVIIYAHQEIRIKSATLLTFLNIMQVIKYWELKQLLIALIDMPQEKSWELKIEQLIIIYRETEDEGEDYEPGDRWTLISKIIDQDDRLNSRLKNELKDLFLINRGSGYLDRSNLKQQELYSIRKAMAIPPFNQVESVTKDLLDFIIAQNISSVNSQTVSQIYNYLVSEINTSNDTVANDIKPGGPNNGMADTSREVQTIVQELKQELQDTNQIEQETQDMIGHLEEFEKIFEQNEQVFAAISAVDFTNWDDPSPQQMYSTIKRLDERVNMDLTNAQSAQNLEQAVRAMHEHLQTAHQELEDIEQRLQDAMGLDQDTEKHVSALEEQLGELEKAVQILEQFNSNQ
ncbi:MAG: hypothetical protein V5A72_03390, partial [Candidatus Nanohaloarchaea archaeon]